MPISLTSVLERCSIVLSVDDIVVKCKSRIHKDEKNIESIGVAQFLRAGKGNYREQCS